MAYSHGGNRRSFGARRSHSSFNRGNNKRSFNAKASTISHSRYVHAAVELPPEEVIHITHTFEDFALHSQLQVNVQRRGYTTPTPIQDQAIPELMNGRDVVGIANTGTGKTAAFLLPLMHKVINDPNQGVLIVAPTRELALQIHEEFIAFAHNLSLSVALCIGGTNLRSQLDRLRKNPHFVIGTPGRLIDVIKRGALDTEMFNNIVLDEVDRMLDIGFRKDIKYLISLLPRQRQAAFFSATMNRETEEIMHDLMSNPVKISVKKHETSHHIHQDVVKLRAGQNKVDVLHGLLTQEEFEKVIVFGRTKHGINSLEKQLHKRGVRVTAIHGNKTQNARQRALEEFKRGRVQALLATDVAARGIDIDGVTHVINYDEPATYEDYVHRIGRTGRAGKTGKALTFIY